MANRTSTLAKAIEHFHEHGFAVLPGYLSEDDLAPAQAELELMFPTAEEYHAGADPDRNARFTNGVFAGIDPFPYSSVEWSLLGLSPPIAPRHGGRPLVRGAQLGEVQRRHGL